MKVLAVSGTGEDWGLLCPALVALQGRGVDVVLSLTAKHLAPDDDQGRAVAVSGFPSFHRIDMGLASDDSPRATGDVMGASLAGMARLLAEVRRDLLLVLGDRYEMLAMVAAALQARVPVAHIAGGDVTDGAFDDVIRHATTRLSALHFVTNAEARARLLQLGETPERVFLTGSPGIDPLLQTPKLDPATLFADLGLDPDPRPVFPVTFHPPTFRPMPLLKAGPAGRTRRVPQGLCHRHRQQCRPRRAENRHLDVDLGLEAAERHLPHLSRLATLCLGTGAGRRGDRQFLQRALRGAIVAPAHREGRRPSGPPSVWWIVCRKPRRFCAPSRRLWQRVAKLGPQILMEMAKPRGVLQISSHGRIIPAF